MKGLIDLTETSSDEEDTSGEFPVPLSATHAKGVPKKFSSSGEGSNGGLVGRHGGRAPSGTTYAYNHPDGIDKGKVHSLLHSSTNGRSPSTLIGKVAKQEKITVDEAGFSPRLSTWGDPLPPESRTDFSRDNSPSPRENGTSGNTNLPSRVLNNGSDEVQNSERRLAFGTDNNGSRSRSPTPSTSSPGGSGICRHFWRAGDYEARQAAQKTTSGAMDHVRVHPKFLHSNATSHKWALGAVAELLDNAVDEIQNGATFVSVDKIVNPRDNSPALLVQDDGGGMNPNCMRQCMSLGYSRKNTNTTIGQYGNGFKTSTMRLGADVIVFSRCTEGSTLTQSIGLLSYTFLRKTGLEDVVVPMIDYEVSPKGIRNKDPPRKILRSTADDWQSNFSSITQWSPYASEELLLEQFDDIGLHGTKVIVYNLWFNDDGVLELDFDSDEQDIQLRGGLKHDKAKPVQQQLSQQHIANRYHHSLRVYTSILYLQMPPGFQFILRGKPIEHHSIAGDLKFPEQIVYKPQIGNSKESSVITVIGFTKEAPLINVHGFNVYHKNRLIMPFWKVLQENSSRGRGVVGVLEANFVEPAHDKQDFERTAVLLRLETRLKQMTVEYWNLHCHLIGYQPLTKAGKARKQAAAPVDYPLPIASIPPVDTLPTSLGAPSEKPSESVAPGGSRSTSASDGPEVKMEPLEILDNSSKRASPVNGVSEAVEKFKRQRTTRNVEGDLATVREEGGISDGAVVEQPFDDAMVIELIQENSELRLRCSNFENGMQELESKVLKLEKELMEIKMKKVQVQELQENGLQHANY